LNRLFETWIFRMGFGYGRSPQSLPLNVHARRMSDMLQRASAVHLRDVFRECLGLFELMN
jgi:hypothetical protein